MYDRAKRFKALYSNTPEKVGPTTYFLTDIFDKHALGNATPFNSTQVRTSAFENKSSAQIPASKKYKICFRKIRIVGGTSMQNRAPRMKYKILDIATRGPYSSKEPKKLPGKIQVGVPPRGVTTNVSTIPEKGTKGYDITSTGLMKVCQPPENRPIGPAEYYNPEGHHNYTTLKYKGNFWSLRTAIRFHHEESEGPSPAEYSIGNTASLSPWEKYQILLQSQNIARGPLLRTSDMLQRKVCLEDLPGPGAYSPFDPNTKKCECGKLGTFTKSRRQDLYQTSEGPGPADYVDPKTALDKVNKYISWSESPFSVEADRFPQLSDLFMPGPSDYSPKFGIWNDIQKKGHSKYAEMTAPFDTSAQRDMSMTNPDSRCIPGPDWYYPQNKGDKNQSSMFASTSTRGPLSYIQSSPGPAVYSTTEPFKIISDQKSHLQNKNSAFLVSAKRLEPLEMSSTPAPNTYNLPKSTLSGKGCTISHYCQKGVKDITPGPPDYEVHPKYAKSAVFHTYNVTLQPPAKKMSNQQRRNATKKLRAFTRNRYSTGHCPRTCVVH